MPLVRSAPSTSRHRFEPTPRKAPLVAAWAGAVATSSAANAARAASTAASTADGCLRLRLPLCMGTSSTSRRREHRQGIGRVMTCTHAQDMHTTRPLTAPRSGGTPLSRPAARWSDPKVRNIEHNTKCRATRMIGSRRTASIPLARVATAIERFAPIQSRNVAHPSTIASHATQQPRPTAPTDSDTAGALPTSAAIESFDRQTETFSAPRIDDASSTPRSFLSGKPAQLDIPNRPSLGQSVPHGPRPAPSIRPPAEGERTTQSSSLQSLP